VVSTNEEINAYGRQLTQAEIAAKAHRDFVGGLWDEIGLLQINFMKEHGLAPRHDLLDIGCGALRGGIQFIHYLDRGHYYGIDINPSLIEAGKKEIQEAGLMDKQAHLLVNGKFEAGQFGKCFDYAIAQSVFTHLPINHIVRCLAEMRKVLKPGGVFFATFFEAPSAVHLDRITHPLGGIVTNYDIDPFHYSFEEIEWMARAADMRVNLLGDWKHPRNQKMLAFGVRERGTAE
jgi:ubiquinone/menaquinone biosynthesis C-methylase UbiE